jgi:hypothetical protein
MRHPLTTPVDTEYTLLPTSVNGCIRSTQTVLPFVGELKSTPQTTYIAWASTRRRFGEIGIALAYRIGVLFPFASFSQVASMDDRLAGDSK